MIRLLADENLSRATVEKLRTAGFDVAFIMEDARGAPDVEVLRIAKEQDRVLVTQDRDFGELIYRDLAPVPPGVLFLRLLGSPEAPANVLINLLKDPSFVFLGRFSVISRDGVRQRALP
jgi:predicted nuclease of predicted toxin-antitoxin system